MQLTNEQERAVMDGADRHADAIRAAISAARGALFGPCSSCWYNHSAAGCRGRACPVGRLIVELGRVSRLIQRGKLLPEWYKEARAASDLSGVPFLFWTAQNGKGATA